MGRAGLSLEDGGHRTGIDADKRFARIDVLGLGSVDGLDADRPEKGQIGLKIARVRFIVFARPELEGVDEDRDDHVLSVRLETAGAGRPSCTSGRAAMAVRLGAGAGFRPDTGA